MTASDNLRGIGLMAGSMALFAFEDMFLKFAAADLPTGEILLITCLFGMSVLWRPRRASKAAAS